MPFITIQLAEGQSEELKAQLIERTTQVVADTVGVPADRIRVLIQDVPLTNWGIGGKSLKQLFPHLAQRQGSTP